MKRTGKRDGVGGNWDLLTEERVNALTKLPVEDKQIDLLRTVEQLPDQQIPMVTERKVEIKQLYR